MMIKTIKKFSEILSINNGLYVFDIDETFMVFNGITGKWWEKESNALLGRYPKEKAERLMDEKFRKKITKKNPKPTDLNGFKDIEKRSKLLNNDIIFLTARTEDYREITMKQLEYIYPGINYPVYFSSEKGKALKEIIDNSEKKYEEVVFVDDKDYNINDVLMDNPETRCYLFDYREYIHNFNNL